MNMNEEMSEIRSFWDFFYIHPILSLREWLYWIIFGISIYFFGEFFIYLFDDTRYPLTHISLTILLAISGAFNNYAKKEFIFSLGKVRNLLIGIKTEEEFNSWLIQQVKKAFALSSWQSRFSIGIVTVVGFVSLFNLGFPFHSLELNILASIKLSVIFMVCGHGTYILYRLSVTLIDISKWVNDKPPNKMLPDPNLLALRFFYSFVSIYIFIAYITFIVAILNSPYEFSYILQAWLFIIAIYPLGFFLLWVISFYRMHEAIKSKHLEKLNMKIIEKLGKSYASRNKENIYLGTVKQLMSLQNTIAKKRSWPFDINGIIIPILAILPLLMQIYYVARNL